MVQSVLVPCVGQIQEERGDYKEGVTKAILRTHGTLEFLKVGVWKIHWLTKDSLWVALHRKGISPGVVSDMAQQRVHRLWTDRPGLET